MIKRRRGRFDLSRVLHFENKQKNQTGNKEKTVFSLSSGTAGAITGVTRPAE